MSEIHLPEQLRRAEFQAAMRYCNNAVAGFGEFGTHIATIDVFNQQAVVRGYVPERCIG